MRRSSVFPVLVVTLALGRCTCGDGEPPPPDGGCVADEDCDSGRDCVPLSSGNVCAARCDADAPCPADYACVLDGNELACVGILDDLAVGQRCEADTECASGACVGPDENGESFCAALCTDDDDCAEGDGCYLAAQRYVCLGPLEPAVATGGACPRGPRQCASKRCVVLEGDTEGTCLDACTDGTDCSDGEVCYPLATGGDVCVTSFADGDVCVGPDRCAGGRCERLEGDPDSVCTRSCDFLAGCAGRWACIPPPAGPDGGPPVEDPYCLPLVDDAGPDGARCGSARDCASGYCARFGLRDGGPGVDGGPNQLCASPCVGDASDGGACEDPSVCWEFGAPDAGPQRYPDLCGPLPPP